MFVHYHNMMVCVVYCVGKWRRVGVNSIKFRNWNCSPIPIWELELKLVELKMELESETLELELKTLELELKTRIDFFATATTALTC